MAMPSGIGIVDTMIGFPAEDFKQYDFIREQLKDGSEGFDFPVEYMFKNVPKELYGAKDPISVTLHEMDRFDIDVGVIGVGGDVSRKALSEHPDRFVGQGHRVGNRLERKAFGVILDSFDGSVHFGAGAFDQIVSEKTNRSHDHTGNQAVYCDHPCACALFDTFAEPSFQ